MLQYYIKEPEAEYAEAVLDVADALEGAQARSRARPGRMFPIVMGLSFAAHAIVAAAFLIGPAQVNAGGGVQEFEVISVALISASDLQAASRSSAANPVVQAEPAQDRPPSVLSDGAVPARPEATIASAAEPVLPSPALDTSILPMPPDVPTKLETIAKPTEPDRRVDKPDQAALPSQSGGAPSAAVSIGSNASGEAAASQGEMDRYARDIALAVARNRPKSAGAKGRVTVEFTVSAVDGGVASIKIFKSSGSSTLDALATSVVSKSKFPPVPIGMTPAQLTYRVPFAFE